jgi:hypothetical protein
LVVIDDAVRTWMACTVGASLLASSTCARQHAFFTTS